MHIKPAFCLLSLLLLLPTIPADGSSFEVTPGQTQTSGQSLSSGQTGTVDAGGTLKVGSSTNAIAVTGSSTITNNGTIQQTGTGRAIRDNSGNLTLTVNNNASATIQTADADVIQMNVAGSNVTLNNRGVMTSLNASKGGAQAVDFNALTSGSNVINNYTGATMQAANADAVRPGVNGIVRNDGTIKSTATTDTGSDGIDAQTNSGITITNGSAITGDAAGSALIEGARHGITGGNTSTSGSNPGAFALTLTNNAGAAIQGDNGSGINIDGINANETVTITNRGAITGNGTTGDGDGVDVDGLVNLDNFGTIKSLGANGDTSEGVTVGGGTIKNEKGDLIEGDGGSSGVGITLAGVDKDSSGNPIAPRGIYAASSVDNFGTIRGQSGSGIQATSTLSTFGITITNETGGLIEGAGSNAAVQLDGAQPGVSNKLVNYGTIKADSSNLAVDLGGGTNEFDVMGGAATVTGNISGGAGSTNSLMNVQAGTGNTFSYSGTITNFANVKIVSGTFSLGGTVTGGTTTIQSGGTLAGNGTVGALVIAAGGTLSPGNSPGVIHATSAVLNPTGNFLFQVDTDGSTGSAGTNWDQLAVSGAVNVSALGTGNTFVFELQSLNSSDQAGALTTFNPNTNHTWHDVVTSLGFTGVVSPSDFTVDTSRFANAFTGAFSLQQEGTSLDLLYAAAPEPAVWALMLTGASALLAVRRFRSHSL